MSNTAYAACILEGALCQKLTVNIQACEYNNELATKIGFLNLGDPKKKSKMIHQYRITAKIIKSSSVVCEGENNVDLGLQRDPNQVVNIIYNADSRHVCNELKGEVMLLVNQSCCDVIGSDQWCGDFEVSSIVKD